MEKGLKDLSESSSLISLKLDSSEEVIAKIINIEDGILWIENPLLLVLQSKENQGYISLIPWTFSNNQSRNHSVPININKIVSFFEPDPEMKKKYYK